MAAVSNTFLALALMLLLAMPAHAALPDAFQMPPAPERAASLSASVPTDLALEEKATVRHSQLQWHQAFGLATLGSMALTAGLGAYTGNFAGPGQYGMARSLHMALGGVTTGLYLGAATLAVTAPEGYDVEASGLDSVTLHRYLAWLHAAGIGATVAMGVLTSIGRADSMTHGLLGGTTLGLLAVSAGVIVLDF